MELAFLTFSMFGKIEVVLESNTQIFFGANLVEVSYVCRLTFFYIKSEFPSV